jgi:hypothetical protein
VDCAHSGNAVWRSTDSGNDLTRQEKICSPNLRELTAWASKNKVDLRLCRDCRPGQAVASNRKEVRYWMYHWQNRFWRNEVNAENEPLSSAYGSQFSKRGIKSGDFVYVVSLRDGRLMIGGRMTVGDIVPPEAKKRDEWLHAQEGTGTPLHLNRRLPRGLAKALRLVSSGSKVKSLLFDRYDKTRLDVQTTRGIRELTMESAARLNKFIKITDRARDRRSLSASTHFERRNPKKSRDRSPLNRESIADYYEGGSQHSLVSRYERNRQARVACIAHYGAVCCICDTDLSLLYGPAVKGLIHVHHLRLISRSGGRASVNPIKDLRPVCPNCHAVLHYRDTPYSIQYVRQLLKRVNLENRPSVGR